MVVCFDQPCAAAHEHLDRARIAWSQQATGNRAEVAARTLGLPDKGLYLEGQRLGMLAGGEQPPAS